MAKYSTGGSSGGGSGGSCELCGKSSDALTEANVAGAQLRVCSDCASSHNDNAKKTQTQSGGDDERNRRKKAAQNAAKASGVYDGDSSHWEEEGTNYDDDQLPYLVADYGETVERARQDEGLRRDELAEELDVPENDLLAVEQGRANQANVGGSLIEALEDRLDVQLAENR
ncbi:MULTISPECIES: multiprotein-bridging factor 1 family protein [Halorussus]|uniref:helix-turn-helix domain-containing protein n=1 Tax=Halorussus TaxID=1070314 RepID=UPI000E2199C5|nr:MULTISPECIES: multiprotein-bridging factor 1 family protein [Halorussus]NHN59496.1 multiprotein-bridging factor 1 family protein [Halorussus sp. JP-T4]